VGGNAEAARLSGISERQITIRVFVLNGLLVGISAILYATNFTAIQSNAVTGFELTVITAAVIGGVSILGGTGTVFGALLGAILLQIIGSALVFLHIRSEWFQTVQGSLILLTILLDVFRRRQTSSAGVSGGNVSATASSPHFLNLPWLTVQEAMMIGILVLAMAVLSFTSDRFLTPANLLNQVRFLTETALLAVPMTFIIILGGIDLSVGSMVALSAILLGFSWQTFHLPLPLAVVIAILGATLAGCLNGLASVCLGVPPLIVTLATLAIYRGLSYGISESRSVHGFPESFSFWGSGDLFGLPVQLYLLVAVLIVSALALACTPFGRCLYAIGNNETAARFAGLRVGAIKLIAYSLSGFMAGLAGFIYTSRVTSTRADAATGLELDVIAAVVFGGTSIFGGRGTILGTTLGVVIIQLLKNGLQLSGVRGEGTVILIGSVLIASILLNQLLEKYALAGQRSAKTNPKPTP
jgi:rhamnose transport system permease protein